MVQVIERRSRRGLVLVLIAAFAVVAFAAGAGAQDVTVAPYQPPDNIADLSGTIESDGSSTVGPITEAVIEEFAAVAPNVQVTNSISGTGGGFERFCVTGDTDIQNASRAIADDEVAACAASGIDFFGFEVAFDGLSILVNPANDFLTCLNVEALRLVFSGQADSWDDLNPEFPAEEFTTYSPGTDSGTYDYFSEAIMEDGDVIADEYSEDDNVLVEGIAGDENAIGFFGFAYYEQNQDRLKLVEVDGGTGCVAPSPDTVRDGSYTPLSRPLYVYVKAESLTRSEVQEFLRFYIANLEALVPDVGYVTAPTEDYVADQAKLEGAIAGTVPPDSQAAGTPEA
jgi:phosphate transport system substrate-binding protein